MVNYQNGKIYKIVDISRTKIYIGSTTKQYVSQRMDEHRRKFRDWKLGKYNYTSSFQLFEEFGVDNCIIELIELYPCESRDELNMKEGEHIKNNVCVNKNVAGRTVKEYREDNKEKLKEINKEYYQSHKETTKQYYQDNILKVKDYNKEYRDKNKEEINAKKKLYYHENKEKYKEKYRLKISVNSSLEEK